MRRSLAALTVTVALLTTALYAQEPPESPTQAETLAKWPWSISLQTTPFVRQFIEIKLAPLEGMEYKYRLDEDAGMLYSWRSTGEVHWELHSQPDDAPQGYAEFFDTDDGNESHGVYTAPFPGIHGWWWENTTEVEVTITLTTAGFYTESHDFRRGQPVEITAIE